MRKLTPLSTNLLICLVCGLGIAVALYLQLAKGLAPCPLCVVQRIAMVALGGTALLSVLHNPKYWGIKIYAIFMSLMALLGVAAAGRQVWLQFYPVGANAVCLPSFTYIMNRFPLPQAIAVLFKGTGDCAQINWTLLGLSLPMWTLICFTLLLLVAGYQLVRPLPTKNQQ